MLFCITTSSSDMLGGLDEISPKRGEGNPPETEAPERAKDTNSLQCVEVDVGLDFGSYVQT